MFFWRLFRDGSNHPSIAQRGVSCSKVDLGEPDSNKTILFVLKTNFKVLPCSFNNCSFSNV